MIEIKNISMSYVKGKKALDNINFTIEKGTLNSLVGPSGCGKTTMLKILAGFLLPDEGAILIDGEDITHLPIQKRGTAMVFQNYALWPHMTIYDNIAYGLRLQKVPEAEIEKKIENILKIVEIDFSIVRNRYPGNLSGGQQQRVALARALVVEPKILLMDEPLSNLDAKVRQRLRMEIREIQQKLNVTVVYVTHDQEEAMSMSDQVIVMNEGVIAQSGTPQEVYNEPKNAFVAEFLGHSNVINAQVRNGKIHIEDQNLNIDAPSSNKNVKLIIRANDIFFSENEDMQQLTKIDGEIIGSMYVGTFYRHLVKIGEQELFVDTNIEKIPNQKLPIYINSEKILAY